MALPKCFEYFYHVFLDIALCFPCHCIHVIELLWLYVFAPPKSWWPSPSCFWSFDHDLLHCQVCNGYCHYGLALDWSWVVASYIGRFWCTRNPFWTKFNIKNMCSANAIIFLWQLSCLIFFFQMKKTHLRNQYMEEYHNEKVAKNILKSFSKTLLKFE